MNDLWTDNITIKYVLEYIVQNKEAIVGYVAECQWSDNKTSNEKSIEGTISNKYYVPTITEAIDNVLNSLKTFNIKLCTEMEETKHMDFILFKGKKCLKTEEVENIIIQEAKRRGWKYYVER